MKRNLRILLLLAAAMTFATANAQDSPAPQQENKGMPEAAGMKDAKAQIQAYQAFIYTDQKLGDDIRVLVDEFYSEQMKNDGKRGVLKDMGVSALSALKGIGSNYITSAVDLGVTALSNLITKNKRQKEEWKKTIDEENKYETKISTISDVNDFYSSTSAYSPMDPADMKFNGIGCIKKEGNDTVFYVSCHIDRSKLSNIINHSKFNLILDTLIVSPYHSNLPNTRLNIPFSYKERKDFNIKIGIKLYSSWINPQAVLIKDQELGEFSISVPVMEQDLVNGYIRYVRQDGMNAKYAVEGESFVVPRSYMGFRDANGEYHESFGTGEYKLDITLNETCSITDELDKNWKSDKKRHNTKKNDGLLKEAWKEVKSQNWNDITKQWVITVVKGPVSILSEATIKELHLDGAAANATPSASSPTTTQSTTPAANTATQNANPMPNAGAGMKP